MEGNISFPKAILKLSVDTMRMFFIVDPSGRKRSGRANVKIACLNGLTCDTRNQLFQGAQIRVSVSSPNVRSIFY